MQRTSGLVLCALAAVTAAASAQSSRQPIELIEQGSSLTVANRLAAPIGTLVLAFTPDGQLADWRVVQVGARDQASFPRTARAGYGIAELEVLDARVGLRSLPACRAAGTPDEGVAALRAAVDSMLVSESGAAEAAISAAAAVARVDLQQRLDSIDTYYNDPLKLRLEDKQIDYKPWQVQGMARNEAWLSNQAEQGLAAAMALGLAYSDESDAKKRVAEDEKNLLKPVAEHGAETVAMLETRLRRMRATGEAYARLAEAAARSLGGAVQLPRVSALGIARLCSGPAVGEGADPLVLSGLPASTATVLITRAEFDRGGSQAVVFRRLGNDTRWIGRLYWPADAASVSFSATSRIRISAGRHSLSDAAANARAEVRDIQKRYRAAGYRAAGGDDLKTMIVPDSPREELP